MAENRGRSTSARQIGYRFAAGLIAVAATFAVAGSAMALPQSSPSQAPAGATSCDSWPYFDVWMTWLDSGGPRPQGLPARVPPTCWARRASVLAKRRPAAPTAATPVQSPLSLVLPGATPVTITGPSPIKLPIAFTAWGFHIRQWTAQSIANQLVASGFRSIAIQIGDADHPTDSSVAAAMHAAGLAVYAWGTPHGDGSEDESDLKRLGADGWLPNVETDGQYQALLIDLARGVGAGLPRVVVTNFEGIEGVHLKPYAPDKIRDRMQPLMDAGIDSALIECYLQNDPPCTDVSAIIDQAHGFGWVNAYPLVGTYQDVRLGQFDLTGFEQTFGIYLVEEINPADWAAAAKLTGRSG